jgi:hypothetical protein
VTELAVDTSGRDADLHAFVQRVRTRHGRQAARRGAVAVGLGAAVPAIVFLWATGASTTIVAFVVATIVGVAAVVAWTMSRTAAARAHAALLAPGGATAFAGSEVNGAEVDGVEVDATLRARLAELGDELLTWLEPARAGQGPMRSWLAHDVRSKLPQLGAPVVAAIGRRRFGRSLWLLPLALLLLLVWFLADLLSPPWPGAFGGRTTRTFAGNDGNTGNDGQGKGGGGAGEQQPEPEPKPEPQPADKPELQPPPPTAPPPPPGPEPETPEPEAPAPLLDLPTQHRFLVPEFVGDGPTRRARMHAAEIADDPPGATTNRSAPAGGKTAPPPSRDEFERAAEAAQRARHVPPHERAMVARFFELLREAAK